MTRKAKPHRGKGRATARSSTAGRARVAGRRKPGPPAKAVSSGRKAASGGRSAKAAPARAAKAVPAKAAAPAPAPETAAKPGRPGGNLAIKARIEARLNSLGLSARAASIKAGLTADAIRNVLRERSKFPRGDTLRQLAGALDCSVDWLLTGTEGSPGGSLAESIAATAGTASIAEVDVRAGMGGGGLPEEIWRPSLASGVRPADKLRGLWRLPESYLERVVKVDAFEVRIVEVQGDSMEPTLRAGDRVMVNLEDRVPSPPGIFALWDGFGVVVKRLEPAPNSDPPRVVVSSDNRLHAPYERTAEEINIIGRVVWYCRAV